MKTKSRKARIFPALLLFCGFRACSHKRSMWIFEQVFGRIKSKIRRCTCVPQEFLAKKMAKNRQKDACKRLCEHALKTTGKPCRQIRTAGLRVQAAAITLQNRQRGLAAQALGIANAFENQCLPVFKQAAASFELRYTISFKPHYFSDSYFFFVAMPPRICLCALLTASTFFTSR